MIGLFSLPEGHTYEVFSDDSGKRYRGLKCECGFTASTGEADKDLALIREHLNQIDNLKFEVL